jgi:hypothetical protein
MGQWKHRKKLKTDNTPDPTESAFFSNETVGSISTALVREGDQNVLDEIKDKVKEVYGPARVRITHSGNKYAVGSAEAKNILGELIPHLQAEKNGIIPSDLPDFSKPMPYLLFEDFNTNGLEGDPGECLYNDYNDSSKAHNFYFFWRAYGRSGKLSNKMGSWGVGKSVFPAVSAINSFWALTIRESDKEAYLIGQSILKTHDRSDQPAPYGYFPWGFYGVFDKEDFAMPETSISEIKKFQQLFRLKRKLADKKEDREPETGVSIIIPYPKEEVNAESLALATIKQFFYPILKGKLEVDIQYEDQVIVLKKDNLKREVERLDFSKLQAKEKETTSKDQLLSLFEMAAWMLEQKEQDHIRLQRTNPNRAYRWVKELFENIDLNKLQKQFDNGEPFSFIIPVKHHPEGEQAELREFYAYIKKDLTLQEPESIFIRDALTITGVKSLKRKGARGIVVISDRKLVTFFGQAEGPAHTGWHKDNFRVKYENTDEIISFVQRSLQELFNKLQLPAEGLDKTLLSDLFFIEVPESEDGKDGGKKEGKKKGKDPDFIPLPKRIKKYKLTQLEGESGFKITNNFDSEELPETVSVTLAYDRPDGRPFKKYSALDFNVKNMKVEKTNVVIETQEKNVIEFTPTEKAFELIVTGFDQNRDLIINVN